MSDSVLFKWVFSGFILQFLCEILAVLFIWEVINCRFVDPTYEV